MISNIGIVLVVLLLVLLTYIRLAPTDPAKWHGISDRKGLGDHPSTGGFMAVRRVTASQDEVLSAVRDVALATDRTQLIAGSVEDGMMTFQTRSKLIGFPDYTTVRVEDDMLTIYGRLRFGRSDLGVNAERIREWLAVLGPLTVPL